MTPKAGTPGAAAFASSRRWWYHHCSMLPASRLAALAVQLSNPALDVPDRVARARCARTLARRRYVRMAVREDSLTRALRDA